VNAAAPRRARFVPKIRWGRDVAGRSVGIPALRAIRLSHGHASLVRYRGGWDIDITPSTGLMHIDRDPVPRLHYAAWPARYR
jgi:hypothetical protein